MKRIKQSEDDKCECPKKTTQNTKPEKSGTAETLVAKQSYPEDTKSNTYS